MKQIKILGTGCAKCIKTAEIIQTVADSSNVSVEIAKETSPEVIMSYGVMSTPAVVIDEQLMHSGSIPSQSMIREWLLS
ncbi:thioredoxin family protein [Neptunomonas phycophila]|uniref:thioredoxin family protein n=1 Tax=Neptunomonas phycophila TaxID=1572645 RepID=UPI0009490524|nr:thioredoxin family protein [Neptunomonas phycophila]QLE97137.1 thioredoxin family protein [Neptunomonas phycophila]